MKFPKGHTFDHIKGFEESDMSEHNNTIKKLDSIVSKAYDTIEKKGIAELIKLIPAIKKVQPKLTGARNNMGGWWFTGKAIGEWIDPADAADDPEYCNKLDTDYLLRYIWYITGQDYKDECGVTQYLIACPVNKALAKFAEIAEYLNNLNLSFEISFNEEETI